MLPERLRWDGAHSVTLVPGQEAPLAWDLRGKVPELTIHATPALPWWSWAIVALIVLVPVALVLLHQLHLRSHAESASGDKGGAGFDPFGIIARFPAAASTSLSPDRQGGGAAPRAVPELVEAA